VTKPTLVVKRKVATFLQVHLINPRVRREAGESDSPAALLETTGRRSGLPRQIPVFYGRQGDVVWIVAHHGRSAAYVRNMEANPRVRVKFGGRWLAGSASLMPDEDPWERLGSMHPHAPARAKQLGTDLLAIRVDLDPVSA
jgi:deazaflavin-dependent oxidoreductase (nitroreductase family)